jgi:hypothetical protein
MELEIGQRRLKRLEAIKVLARMAKQQIKRIVFERRTN